ncbi:MAG: hypothetical protein ACREJM_09395 [Candidatus Saccharimonadales bacterium]
MEPPATEPQPPAGPDPSASPEPPAEASSTPPAAPAPETPSSAPDPGISQTFTPTNKPAAPPPPFTPAATPDIPPPAASVPAQSTPPAGPVVPGQPGVTAVPSLPAEPGTQPVVTVGDGGVSAPSATGQVFTATPPTTGGPAMIANRFSKKLLIPVLAVLVLLVGAAAFYFGYYQNPSVIYSQSLSNTGKGYDNLVGYLDQQSKTATKGYTGSGTYSIKASGYTTDGQLSYKSNGKNTDMGFDIGAGTTRINTEIRSIKSTGTVPDLYFKFGGIKGLGDSLGDPALNPELAKLDGRWIVVDHTVIENLEAASGQTGSSGLTTPTHEQILDEARAFGKVNQQYVFTTAKDKAVTKVVKKYGRETVGGHKTYHYQVALQPDNVKKYILAQRDALRGSQLDAWLKKNNVETSTLNSFTQAADSAKDIKSSDTFDVWMDTSHRVIYKVRINDTKNPAENYADIGLDYKGGSDYPFFISGKSQASGSSYTYSFVTDLDTKTHSTGVKVNEQSTGSDSLTINSDFNFKANTTPPAIATPVHAIPLSQVLDDLGLGGLLGGTSSSSSGSSSNALVLKHDLSGLTGSGNPVDSVRNTFLDGLISR